MGLVAGPISANSLIEKLANAKKLMNKVETGDYQRGNIDESMILDGDIPINMENITMESQVSSQNLLKPIAKPIDSEKLNKSKMPDEIKRAMIEHPIPVPDISIMDTVDANIFAGAKRLMEQENVGKKTQKQAQQPIRPTTNTNILNNSDLVQTLLPIIENTIRKVLDEKLNQILATQQAMTINENLVLKVGNSIFEGKITGVRKPKK